MLHAATPGFPPDVVFASARLPKPGFKGCTKSSCQRGNILKDNRNHHLGTHILAIEATVKLPL